MIIIAGITRSGLSLTMQMLHAGGYPCTGEPPAFEEYAVGEIPWQECQGRAVKLIDAHLQLPPGGPHDVIRLRRNLTEQARSFNKFVACFGHSPGPLSRIIGSFRSDYRLIDEWLKQQRVMVLDFETIIAKPKHAACMIREFLGNPLDTERMAACVVKRQPDCHPTMLELSLEDGQ